MARRAAFAFLAAAPPLLLAAFFLGGRGADWLTAALVGAFPVALVTFAVSGRGRAGRLGGWLVALLVLLEGCLLGALGLTSTTTGAAGSGPWLGGFPAPTALLIYGLGAGALLLSGIAYAATFEPSEGR